MGCSIEKDLIDKTIAFHGHSCPGLAIGIRAAELALKRLGYPEGKDLVAVVETDMCGVDAIQFLTGCTFGKGNLIYKDYGKMAFSFYDRSKDMGFRVLLRPDISGDLGPELRGLMRKVEDGTANEEEHARLKNLRGRTTGEIYECGFGGDVHCNRAFFSCAKAGPDFTEPAM
jgi:formylmethanofuran dehydrogenase subunit E